MPEGNVIHKLARDLNHAFQGHDLRVTSPQGRFRAEATHLNGTRLHEAQAWGKHLFLDFDVPASARVGTAQETEVQLPTAHEPHPETWEAEHIVHIHLGLIGSFRIVAYQHEKPAGQVRLSLHRLDAENSSADFSPDAPGPFLAAHLRGPQWCRLISDEERDAVIATLGADPLRGEDLSSPAVQKVLRRAQSSSRSVAALLMDQSLFAGVGNIYRAEVLFRAGINPQVKGVELPQRTWVEIWVDLEDLMRHGERAGRIDTVRPQHMPEAMGRPPRIDDHGGEVYVYRRAGLPCLVCGTPIAHTVVHSRNLFWCPRCQR